MSRLNLLEETRFEKIPLSVFENQQAASITIARKFSDLILRKQANGELVVLGLATGASPILIYQELVRLHKEEGLSFKNVVSFNLDEYFPMKPNSEQSYVAFMKHHLFDHIDILPEHIHIPDGTLKVEDVAAYCLEYERKINDFGGLDFQLLGIGRTGHIGFNEPGSAPNSGTRIVTLNDLTRRDASKDFGGKENVPTKAITMGVGTIFKAREIVIVAWNEKKAGIVKAAVEGEISSEVPATYLQLSNNVEFIVDKEAASLLTRFDKPWLVRDVVWDAQITKKAVIWLAKHLNKPILKLTEDDYNNNGMSQLATENGPVYNINIHIFNQLQHAITGWPGGKPGASDAQRPERALPEKKRSIIFSPHPDDDVISMGGTFIRLADQGHDVHVAYQTSGNTAVWDDDVLRYVEFSIDFLSASGQPVDYLKDQYKRIREFFQTKKPNQVDLKEIQTIKGLIRKEEAVAGARFAGTKDENIHFLNLPFYDKFKTKGLDSYEEDILITMDLLKKVKPHQVFAAGDFADPHGTHKVCFDIILEALNRLKSTENWTSDCWLWLYRGAWHEFELHEIQMAVPLSPNEVIRKRHAIFKHQSQKDLPVFPGDDAREFWVRAEERTKETANAYNQLGLAEYEAIEAFVRYIY
ncbi:MAG: glucosamine-6-phosphate deaminase [Pedobacter sp.]|nr:MAG: glucosamine-6-phosphate deaminase [Pedobacter sp.]